MLAYFRRKLALKWALAHFSDKMKPYEIQEYADAIYKYLTRG